jgi:hypothetical protein
MEIIAGNGSQKPGFNRIRVDCDTESEKRLKRMMGKENQDKNGCENI